MNESTSLVQKIDAAFGRYFVEPIGSVIFWDVAFWDNGQNEEVRLPVVVVWLIAGASELVGFDGPVRSAPPSARRRYIAIGCSQPPG